MLIFYIKLLLNDTQVLKIWKAFGNDSSVNTNFPNTYLSKMIQSGGFLADLLALIPQVMFQTGMVPLKKLHRN